MLQSKAQKRINFQISYQSVPASYYRVINWLNQLEASVKKDKIYQALSGFWLTAALLDCLDFQDKCSAFRSKEALNYGEKTIQQQLQQIESFLNCLTQEESLTHSYAKNVLPVQSQEKASFFYRGTASSQSSKAKLYQYIQGRRKEYSDEYLILEPLKAYWEWLAVQEENTTNQELIKATAFQNLQVLKRQLKFITELKDMTQLNRSPPSSPKYQDKPEETVDSPEENSSPNKQNKLVKPYELDLTF
jgi:hypothetical protein